MKRLLPGLAMLSAMTGSGALVGAALGLRFWPLFLALALLGIGLAAWLGRARRRGAAPSRRATRDRRGGSDADFDLEKDTSTDEQRWLM